MGLHYAGAQVRHPCSLDHSVSEASRSGDLCTAWVGQSQGRLNTYVLRDVWLGISAEIFLLYQNMQ